MVLNLKYTTKMSYNPLVKMSNGNLIVMLSELYHKGMYRMIVCHNHNYTSIVTCHKGMYRMIVCHNHNYTSIVTCHKGMYRMIICHNHNSIVLVTIMDLLLVRHTNNDLHD